SEGAEGGAGGGEHGGRAVVAEAARSPRQGALLGAVALAAALVACDGPGRSIADAPPPLVERVVPARAAVGARPPPLVLLHGIGADENDLVPLAARLDPRLTVVSLRAPRRYEGHGGYAWFQIDWRSDGTIVPDAAQARAAVADLDRWIAAAPGRLG